MNFSVFKACKQNRSLQFFGTIEASSLEIAGDLLYRKLRRNARQKDGDIFMIVPDSEIISSQNPLGDGTAFHVLQYREIE